MELRLETDGRTVWVSEPSLGLDDRFHALWLRDACACSRCRRPETNERLLDSISLPAELKVVSANAVQRRATFGFSDGHETTLTTGFLAEHAPSLRDRSTEPLAGRTLWPDDPITSPVVTFDRGRLGDARLTNARLVNKLWEIGAVVVEHVEPTEQGLLAAASLIGTIMPSNYGSTWSIEATVTPESAVDAPIGLQVHTDLPYRRTPAGVQLILGVVTDVVGGASTLVDGYSMAERLRLYNTESWRLLTTVSFDYPYRRPGVELNWASPLISLDHHGAYQFVRRAPDLVGSPIVDADDVPALYQALGEWSALLDDPSNRVEIHLGRGDLLIFDNHRMLHGRTPFELGVSGRRHLIGCYLDIDELNNRRAILAKRSESPT